MPGTAGRTLPHAATPRTSPTRCAAAVFPGASALARDPALRDYLADLAAPYGVALREDLLAAGAGHSYGEMGEALLRAAVAEDDAVDLLVLAFAVPDVRPGRSTALYLSSVCPGRPEAFAVSDQGTAASFTAVRLAGTFLDPGAHHSALVLVLEQSVLHYAPLVADGEAAPALPERHAGVALRFDDRIPQVTQHTDIGRAEAEHRMTGFSANASSVFVLGPGLPDAAVPGEAVRPSGQPLTGIWAAYAEHGERWAADGRRVVLADHDAGMRTLSLCVFEPEDGALA